MKRLLAVGHDEIVGPWVAARSGGEWTPARGTTVALVTEVGEILAGVIYEDYNGVNIQTHIAAVEGRRWLTRDFLWAIFHYPFTQLNLQRITSVVAASNLASRRFVEHLGFTHEATLKEAHPTGDLFVYSMRRETCRWLSLRNSDGQAINSRPAANPRRDNFSLTDGHSHSAAVH